ncbi:PapB/FocB family fimbrial expression transcriptional regulator, partial [Escherichia coli]
MNSEVCLHLVKERSGILLPGEVSERHFWLLIEISGMHSEKVINALREHLVMGYISTISSPAQLSAPVTMSPSLPRGKIRTITTAAIFSLPGARL